MKPAIARAAACILAAGILVRPQDRVKADPHMKILFENARVRVQEHRLRPGEKVAMHSHPENVIVVLNNSKFRMLLASGQTLEGESRMGQAFWSPQVTHAVENIGATEIRNIVIELKDPPKGREQQ